MPHTGTASGYDAVLTFKRTVQITSKPRLSGAAVVGRTLRVRPGTYNPTQTVARYQWLANGKAIRNATRASFAVTRAQLGKRLSVRTSLSAANYNPARVVTAPASPVRRP